MINCFMIAALSADGFITPATDAVGLSTVWTSEEDKKNFVEKTKEAGVVIMGSKTFETFGARPLKERRNIIYSKNKKYEGTETISEDPRKLIARLEKEGVRNLAICGGASIYSLFLEAGVIDKMFLTIEGIVFGQGINLFSKPLEKKLKLDSVNKIGDNTVLLEYSVLN
jgi:dihydrofolate reductase